ncbi:hypothetical protein PGTUg99_034465 [Puccinia graminis f. sp. tritici]|uniref:Uncharacterized protein n=1 Tax=Puccinia graminis f. sp. tritici TaxID=56615 RepID=A0A5B0LX12_PUCGR|nr:hypothetical protein PGTUg99_034465 [Puccinia graminis f. sp. tritici]
MPRSRAVDQRGADDRAAGDPLPQFFRAEVSLIPSPLGLSPVDIVVGLNVGLRALLFSPIRRKVIMKKTSAGAAGKSNPASRAAQATEMRGRGSPISFSTKFRFDGQDTYAGPLRFLSEGDGACVKLVGQQCLRYYLHSLRLIAAFHRT